jgi:hypothetical protein
VATKDRHNAWLSPNGRFYEVFGFAQHNAWAEKFLEEKWTKSGRLKKHLDLHDEIDKELECWSGYCYEVLEKWGWVRILDWGTKDGVQFIFDGRLTKRQKDVIFDLCTEWKIPLPKDIF